MRHGVFAKAEGIATACLYVLDGLRPRYTTSDNQTENYEDGELHKVASV
jgi:hypothetical protein